MPRTRPPYPLEFRQEAVRLARESGKPGTQIAQDLGISYESLRHWIKQADLDTGRLLRSGDRPEARAAFGFVAQEKARHDVATLCRVLGVSSSG